MLSVHALQNHGAPQQAVEIQEVVQEGNSLDITTAARDLEQGEPCATFTVALTWV